MYSEIITYLIIAFGAINIVRMTLFLVGSDLYTLRKVLGQKHLRRNSFPTFTVVIPAYNEELTVTRAIGSVTEADYPEDKLQVLVVDDGSSDKTAALVEEYVRKHKLNNVTLIQQTNKGKAHALNNSIKNHATGELVMCLDADSNIAPDALKNAARYFNDPRVVGLSSNVKIRSTGTFLNLIQVFEYIVCYQMKRAQTFFNIEYIIGGIGSTFRHSALKKVGYYDTDTITEDIDLTFKLLKSGNKDARVIYGSDVITYTEGVLSIGDLIRQRLRWKSGRTQTFLKNTALFFSTHRRHNKFLTWVYLPFAFFADLAFFFEPLLVSYILYVVVRYYDWVTIASAFVVIGTYIALNILAEDTIPWKQKAKLVVIAPSMYFFFYVLSFVEYIALIKSYARLGAIRKSIGTGASNWEHVDRIVRTRKASWGWQPVTGAIAVIVLIVGITGTAYVLSQNSELIYTGADAVSTPVESKISNSVIHTVAAGEYLRMIAEHYYGNESEWPRINTGGNPNLIFPGQKLEIVDPVTN